MEIFENRKKLFDIEKFKGKNHDPIVEAKQDISNCASEKL